jgi:uncharacterized membrane protein
VNLTATGAAGGMMWGTLIGLLFMNPLLGAGALSGWLTDIGIKDKTIREMSEGLPPGGSALFVLVRRVTGDKAIDRLGPFREKGRVIHTSLSGEQEETPTTYFEKRRWPRPDRFGDRAEALSRRARRRLALSCRRRSFLRR